MSSDNYYTVHATPDDSWVVTMGFASDPKPARPSPEDPHFSSHDAALTYACEEYSEYGASDGLPVRWRNGRYVFDGSRL